MNLPKKEQQSANYFFKRITQSLTNVLQMKMERHGITTAQVFAMICLSSEDNQSHIELSKHLNIKAPSLTTLLDKLERKELIERQSDSQDGRTKRIHLSQSGTQLLKENIWPIFNELEGKLLFGFSEEERNLLFSLLIRLDQNIHEYENDCK